LGKPELGKPSVASILTQDCPQEKQIIAFLCRRFGKMSGEQKRPPIGGLSG